MRNNNRLVFIKAKEPSRLELQRTILRLHGDNVTLAHLVKRLDVALQNIQLRAQGALTDAKQERPRGIARVIAGGLLLAKLMEALTDIVSLTQRDTPKTTTGGHNAEPQRDPGVDPDEQGDPLRGEPPARP